MAKDLKLLSGIYQEYTKPREGGNRANTIRKIAQSQALITLMTMPFASQKELIFQVGMGQYGDSSQQGDVEIF